MGQGLRATAALATFGWGVVGPAEVAQSAAEEQRHIYWVSGVMRAGLLVAALPCSVAVTLALVPPARGCRSGGMCGNGHPGPVTDMVLIGQARPLDLAVMETVPRTVDLLTAVALVMVTSSLLAYAATTMVVEAALSAPLMWLLLPSWFTVTGSGCSQLSDLR